MRDSSHAGAVHSCSNTFGDYRMSMTAPASTLRDEQIVLDEWLRAEPPASGLQPEQRIVFSPVSWERYLAIDKILGDDRPGPRLYFLDGEMELMTTSHEHERIKTWIGDFLAIYFEEIGIEIMPRGQATMRLKESGAEPDESWCIGNEKEFPDLVLEIALFSGGVNKLELYRRFQLPEVWFWRRNKLEMFALNSAGSYEPLRQSKILPGLDTSLLERCVAIASWQQARKTFRAGIAKAK
jgi:Uma2 family endonuclease